MKKVLLMLFVIGVSLNIYSQAPQAFAYQGIARNNLGNPISNQLISIRASILDSSATGVPKYIETQSVTTNSLGLFSVSVGMGVVQSGTFSAIPWGAGKKFMKVEFDPTGGSSFVLSGTQQILSVPYALYALNCGNSTAYTAPTVTTNPATSISSSSATLNGLVNANGFIATVQFEYGLTTSYGNISNASPNKVSGNSNNTVLSNITGLIPSTTYHYRVNGLNAVNETNGNDLTFNTLSGVPSATTSYGTDSVNANTRRFHAYVNANGSNTTVSFEYGTTSSYGSTVSAPLVTGTSNVYVTSLNATVVTSSLLYFRVKAVNANGTTYGNQQISYVSP